MALTLKTPGVYVEEISTLPPSVAAVATAIPAFIGYTAIARNKFDGDLNMVPTRISSMLEYETYFGFAANENKITVDVAADGTIIAHGPSYTDRKPFLMYHSMQMYYANGGGPCYITSVGQYVTPGASDPTPVTSVAFNDLVDGLDAVKKQDEPTLLVFPDATYLPEDKFYAIYNDALEQSHDLQDRFTIIDTFKDDNTAIDNLRAGIISDPLYLRYGGAYYPFLKTILSYQYLDSEVMVNDSHAPTYATQVTNINNSIKSLPLHNLFTELNTLKTTLDAIDPVSPTLHAQLGTSKTAIDAKIAQILAYISGASAKLQNVSGIAAEAIAENADTGGLGAAKGNLDTWISTNFTNPVDDIGPLVIDFDTAADGDDLTAAIDAVSDIVDLLGMGTSDPLDVRIDTIKALPAGLLPSIASILALPANGYINANAYLSSYELNNNVMYNRIKAEIDQISVVLPPSSTVAGVYARVDANSGVWTAPANVGLNYVIAPTVQIDNPGQEGMNVTPTGKSVNAIRSFTGRGTLIWGARTLTGNDNEWRYVSVRRLFIFLEESIAEAADQFVFQANDANTWVKMRGMIENFLTLQWKAGALTGAKAEQAFYVRVGLGQTMTAQDILEGRMIVEIGVAAVRPAEFIVLRFIHKMQEA